MPTRRSFTLLFLSKRFHDLIYTETTYLYCHTSCILKRIFFQISPILIFWDNDSFRAKKKKKNISPFNLFFQFARFTSQSPTISKMGRSVLFRHFGTFLGLASLKPALTIAHKVLLNVADLLLQHFEVLSWSGIFRHIVWHPMPALTNSLNSCFFILSSGLCGHSSFQDTA